MLNNTYTYRNYQIWLVWSKNGHSHWIHTEKCCITHIHTYKTKKLPNMVSLIEKWTLPLNSHWQTGPEHISYVPYWIKINMFPTWCNYYAKSTWTGSDSAKSVRSPHGHARSPRSPRGVHTDRWGTVNYWSTLSIKLVVWPLGWVGAPIPVLLWSPQFHFTFSQWAGIKGKPPQDMEVTGGNDKVQLGVHFLEGGMITGLLWSSQFCKRISYKYTTMSRAGTKVAGVEVVPCDSWDE